VRVELEVFVLGPLLTNCYVVWEGEEAVVVDPGGKEVEEVANFLEGRGLKLKYVVATHGHFDHVMGVKRLKSLIPGAKFLLREEDLPLVEKGEQTARFFNMEGYERPEVDGFLGEEVGSLKVIHTPGHTMGSVCLLSGRYLFTGDTLFKGTVGRVDLGGDAKKLMESLELLKLLPDDLVVLPGHGPPTTLGEEKRENPFMNGELGLEEL
jgi:glyoxylase-like metal-dependent hydrolase (beta-lactamase superfamily II)